MSMPFTIFVVFSLCAEESAQPRRAEICANSMKKALCNLARLPIQVQSLPPLAMRFPIGAMQTQTIALVVLATTTTMPAEVPEEVAHRRKELYSERNRLGRLQVRFCFEKKAED
jgi:hypothetical protein